MKLAVVLAGSC